MLATRQTITRHPDAAALLAIMLPALALRLAFTFRAPVFLVHDSLTYFQAGYDLARGSGFELAFKRTPLYPLFIAVVVSLVGEDLQALGFVQHLLGLLTATLTYFLGRALFGRLAGFAAGLLVGLSGTLLLYEHFALAEPLFIPLLLGFALAVTAAVRASPAEQSAATPPGRGTLLWLAIAGLLLGLAALARPVGQALLLVLPLALLFALKSWRRAALGTLAAALGFAAIMVPWMARNYSAKGSFESAGALGQTLTGRITRHDEGFVLPGPTNPSPYTDPIRTEARALILRQMEREARPSAINHRLRNTFGWTEAQANSAMRDVALEIIVDQKERYVRGTLAKIRRLLWGENEDFGRYWGDRKSQDLREEWASNASIAHVLMPVSTAQEVEKYRAAAIANFVSPFTLRWPLLVLLLAGLAGGLRASNRWGTVFLILIVLALVIPAAMLVGYVPRYRYPADPFLAVLIGGGLVFSVQAARRLRTEARVRWAALSPTRASTITGDNRQPSPTERGHAEVA